MAAATKSVASARMLDVLDHQVLQHYRCISFARAPAIPLHFCFGLFWSTALFSTFLTAKNVCQKSYGLLHVRKYSTVFFLIVFSYKISILLFGQKKKTISSLSSIKLSLTSTQTIRVLIYNIWYVRICIRIIIFKHLKLFVNKFSSVIPMCRVIRRINVPYRYEWWESNQYNTFVVL